MLSHTLDIIIHLSLFETLLDEQLCYVDSEDDHIVQLPPRNMLPVTSRTVD